MRKFVDLANITVIAGNGGDGYVSFQKKNQKSNVSGKFHTSNGGTGGDVWLLADANMNTLNYFNDKNRFQAGNGKRGGSYGCTGKRGKDLIIKVPYGTRVCCQKTNRFLGDIINKCGSDRLLVAKGGRCGLGNKRYLKYNFINHSNISRINNNQIRGGFGEVQYLCLELFLMADVGIFGLPNSGKSSFLRLVSNATPKVADYPFTTLVPNLGSVQIDPVGDKFIIADIPGIIKGASVGLGLGVQFLKHLKHCQMLLHFVDINPLDRSDPVNNVVILEKELSNYDVDLISKTRWLIFNKIDLLDRFELQKKIDYINRSLNVKKRYYFISVTNNINIKLLCNDIARFIKH